MLPATSIPMVGRDGVGANTGTEKKRPNAYTPGYPGGKVFGLLLR